MRTNHFSTWLTVAVAMHCVRENANSVILKFLCVFFCLDAIRVDDIWQTIVFACLSMCVFNDCVRMF